MDNMMYTNVRHMKKTNVDTINFKRTRAAYLLNTLSFQL